MEADNTDAEAYPEIEVIVGQTGNPDVYPAEIKGKRFVAKTPEEFDYDEDGNLPALRSFGEGGTSDGRWINTWDGENRLISMETFASVVNAGIPRERLEFAYDRQCRRIRKTALSGFTNGTFSITNTTAYLYDGWNLVTEVSTNRQSAIGNRTSGAWTSPAPPKAPGRRRVALLLLRTSDFGLPCYDGNGNVMALVNAADKSIMATYEYDPFGNTLSATGAKAPTNPFRFSTRYTDDDTGLLYYGYRYLSASLGTWLSRDPIALCPKMRGSACRAMFGGWFRWVEERATSAVELHPVLFAFNSALHRYDSLGLWPLDRGRSSSYKVCCRPVEGKEAFYPLLRHCEVKNECDGQDREEYDAEWDDSEDRKINDSSVSCRCATDADIRKCFEDHPSGQPEDTWWGSNCEASTVESLGMCCLKSSWKPRPWAGNVRGKCLEGFSVGGGFGGGAVFVCTKWEFPEWQAN